VDIRWSLVKDFGADHRPNEIERDRWHPPGCRTQEPDSFPMRDLPHIQAPELPIGHSPGKRTKLIRIHAVGGDDDSPRIDASINKLTQYSVRGNDHQIGHTRLNRGSSQCGPRDHLGMVWRQSS
jgi:hypothetical protein